MNQEQLRDSWYAEERYAFSGWDFSHIEGRYHEEDDIPWDYKAEILSRLKPDMRLLDIDTGGAEFLLSLGHPHENLAATENFPPNIRLLKEKLLPPGVDFREAKADGPLPFGNETFDLVLNRHGSFGAEEIHRVLKPGGFFITQQVGADNDRALVEALYDNPPPIPYPDQRLSIIQSQFEQAGFRTLDAREALLPIRFFDIGALVWFARIIQWEFPGFSVKKNLPCLLRLQEQIEEGRAIEADAYRILMVAQKTE